ncbi:hypothetical protein HZI73_23575 [Vallitalea pronyensis]|uniref:Uncharacterized protein n=1 Tax=Vallitalea pronyensis TaxID=1348613 RepID=A0A8J8SJ39_9FIRM|nr:hypothetical protein [Vallitalea pronyensis]QUI25092.1 hypothetical protein HZI73_23575 [Vallitalea pronyensis]
MVAVISGPKYLEDIDKAMGTLRQEIIYKKVDRDIDILEEQEMLKSMDVHLIILDMASVEDHRKVPAFIRKLDAVKDNLRFMIIAPYSLSGHDTMNDLISMGIYDIIGQDDYAGSHILSALIELYESPSTYAKAIKWDKEVAGKRQQEKDFINTGEGRFGKKTTDVITVEKDKIVGTVVIAVAGVMSRIGTTHTALSIGKFLLRKKHGVAIVEMDHSDAFTAIEKAYNNVERKKRLFSLAGMDFYPFDPTTSVSDLILGDYSYVILDMGPYATCDIPEFRRAQERIIVCGVKDWELIALDALLKAEDKNSSHKYLFNFCDHETFKFVNKSMEHLSCYQGAYNPQPFEENDHASEVYEVLLSHVLPQIKEEKKSFFSYIRKKKLIKQHKPILLKKAALNAGSEKTDFLNFLMIILIISVVVIVFVYLVTHTTLFTGIKAYFRSIVN